MKKKKQSSFFFVSFKTCAPPNLARVLAPVTSVERLVISPVSAPREAEISVLTVRRKVICPESAFSGHMTFLLSLGQQEEGVEAEEVEEIDL